MKQHRIQSPKIILRGKPLPDSEAVTNAVSLLLDGVNSLLNRGNAPIRLLLTQSAFGPSDEAGDTAEGLLELELVTADEIDCNARVTACKTCNGDGYVSRGDDRWELCPDCDAADKLADRQSDFFST
jgi:hypothetical protein